jgi:hypothetical protein
MDKPIELLLMLLLFILVWLTWRSKFTYPIMMLTTLYHEAAHALAAVATGGKVNRIGFDKTRGYWITYLTGGNLFIILNAGYLGSILFGSFFFYLTYTNAADYALTIMGLLVLLIALLWVRDGKMLLWSIAIGIALMVAGILLTGVAENFIARFIGICSVLYSFVKISNYRKMLSHRRDNDTDAEMLQTKTNVPALVWTVAWSILSVAVLLMLANLMITGRLIC